MNKRKSILEQWIIVFSLIVFPAVLFIIIPERPINSFDFHLNYFIDKYLFGNGYYKPSNYPFTAKVVNNFSVIIAFIIAVLLPIWRKNEEFIIPKEIKIVHILFFILILWMFSLWLSISPQEFKNPKGRSFGVTESFHNNPFSFLLLIFAKSIGIYLFPRISISLVLNKIYRNKLPD